MKGAVGVVELGALVGGHLANGGREGLLGRRCEGVDLDGHEGPEGEW